MKNNEHKFLGFVIAGVLLTAIFVPHFFKSVLIFSLILAAICAFFYFTAGKPEREERESNQKTLTSIKKEQERKTKIEIQNKAESLGLFNSQTKIISAQPLVDIIFEKHKLALRNDYKKLLSPDNYGRVTNTQEEEWKWHLIEVAETCKLNEKGDEYRQCLKQLILSKSSISYLKNPLKETDLEKLYLDKFQHIESRYKIPSFEGFKKEYLNNRKQSIKYAEFNEDSLDIKRYKCLSQSNKVAKNYISLHDLVKYRDLVFEAFKNRFDIVVPETFNKNMNGIDYEYFCAAVLKNTSWSTFVLPPSGDHGADIIAQKENMTVSIQCKKYSKPLGNTPVQEITAAKVHYNTDFAAVVTNSTYTKGAQILANSNNVLLLHHDDLQNMEKLLKNHS
mgnify:CR=1 FL=1